MTLYRFDQIADNITIRVEPSDTDLERYVGLEHLDPESLKLRRWGSPSDVIGQKLKFWKGDTIYGKRRAYQRKLAVADFDGICSAHAMVLRAKPNVILPELLPFFLQSEIFHQRAMEISVGSLSPTINWSALAKQEFPLPPVEEQRRIADLLWAADDSIEAHKVSIDKLYGVKESFFENALLHSENPHIEHGLLPQFTTLITDGDHFPPKRVDVGIPHVVVKNIQNGNIDIRDCTYISPTDYERVKKRYTPKSNDLLVTCVGTIGRLALVPESLDFSADRSLIIVRFDTNKVLAEYGYELFNSGIIQNQLSRLSTGTAQQHLYLKDIKRVKVMIPNIDEQKEIVKKAGAFQESIAQLTIHIESLTNLKKEIIKKMLG